MRFQNSVNSSVNIIEQLTYKMPAGYSEEWPMIALHTSLPQLLDKAPNYHDNRDPWWCDLLLKLVLSHCVRKHMQQLKALKSVA